MSESTEQFSAASVKWIIELVSQNFSRDIDSLKNDVRGDIARVEKNLERVMVDMVSRKEFDELKAAHVDLRENFAKEKESVNKKLGFFEIIGKNWKLIVCVFSAGAITLAALIILLAYLFMPPKNMVEDIHAIAIAHQSKHFVKK